MLTLLRAAAGLTLALAVFAGLIVLLVGVNFTQRLDDPEVYAAAFNETGAYNRIYDEVLADQELRERTGRLLGGMDFAVQDEAVDVLRQVMPPEYLREQVEANSQRFTAYLRHERDDLEIYVDLQEPLERVEPAALGKVHQYIDELEVADPASSSCSPSNLRQLAAAAAEPYSRLSQGQLPDTAPSLEILSRECREREFDRWFRLVLNDPVMSTQVSRVLGNEVEELRRAFVEGDTRGFLKAGAGPLVELVIEQAVADVRRNLPPDHRIDLLEWLTSQAGCLGRCQRTRKKHRHCAGRDGQPVAGAGPPFQAGGDAPVAGRHAVGGRRRLPGPGVRAEFGGTRESRERGCLVGILLGGSAALGSQPGGRLGGIIGPPGH